MVNGNLILRKKGKRVKALLKVLMDIYLICRQITYIM